LSAIVKRVNAEVEGKDRRKFNGKKEDVEVRVGL